MADHPVMVPAVLRVVLPALSDADLSVPAVSTLKRICRECRHHLYPHANDILASSQVRYRLNIFRVRYESFYSKIMVTH